MNSIEKRYCFRTLLLLLATQSWVYALTPLFGLGLDITNGAISVESRKDSYLSIPTTTRRNCLNAITVASSSLLILSPLKGRAEDVATPVAGDAAPSVAMDVAAPAAGDVVAPVASAPALPQLEMKNFIDPEGLFVLRVPKGFYTLRRTVKGDLPNAKTGKGRRGSSIFTAGNMAKAEVVAVERFPTRVLLEDNGYKATGDLSTFPGIGDAKAVASLIILRREKDSQTQGARVLESVDVSPDGKTLSFRLRTEIDVQKPELLMEQTGVSRLFRVTVAKATLDSNDGNIMAIFASALEQDFTNGVDGPALQDTVRSFQATPQ